MRLPLNVIVLISQIMDCVVVVFLIRHPGVSSSGVASLVRHPLTKY